MQNQPSLQRAGFSGEGSDLGEALFDAILDSPSGVTFSVDNYEVNWQRVDTPGALLNVYIDAMVEALGELATAPRPGTDPDFPLVLSAGERRSFTANTIIGDPAWRKRGGGALRICEADAAALGLNDGDSAMLTPRLGSAQVLVEVNPAMRAGYISLPNWLGLTQTPEDPAVGVAPNELTSSDHRDPFAGTPYHTDVPVRLEPLPRVSMA